MQYARKPFFLYQFMNRVGILSTFAKNNAASAADYGGLHLRLWSYRRRFAPPPVVIPPFQGGDTMASHGIGGDSKSGPERAADYNRGCQPPVHKTKKMKTAP